MTSLFSYNLRNLRTRSTTTALTAIGIAVTVVLLLAMLGIVSGLRSTFASASDPLRLLVLRKGGNSETTSVLSPEQFQIIRSTPGIATASDGRPMASLEIVSTIILPSASNPDGVNIMLRGISTEGIEVRRLKLGAGRWFQAGTREIVAGDAVAGRYPAAALGKQIHFGNGVWTVVGVLDGKGSSLGSEILADGAQVAGYLKRDTIYSSALLRAADENAEERIKAILEGDPRLNVTVLREDRYYAAQMVSALPIEFFGYTICLIMGVGSSFAAMNTMYASISARNREIGTLRALGFSRASILFSFVFEAASLSLAGGILACLLVLPLNLITTELGSVTTFSQSIFKIDIGPLPMMAGLGFSILLGAAGGFLPAWQASRKGILAALREG